MHIHTTATTRPPLHPVTYTIYIHKYIAHCALLLLPIPCTCTPPLLSKLHIACHLPPLPLDHNHAHFLLPTLCTPLSTRIAHTSYYPHCACLLPPVLHTLLTVSLPMDHPPSTNSLLPTPTHSPPTACTTILVYLFYTLLLYLCYEFI